MQPHVKVDITAGTLAAMTVEQFTALRDNIVAEGKWESVDGVQVSSGGFGDYIGVMPFSDGESLIFIGIEKDGYTHS